MRTRWRSRSLSVAWNQLTAYPTRMVAVVLAIVLGVGFVAATLVFGATYRAGLGATLSARYVPTDVVIGSETSAVRKDLLEQVRAVPGIDTAEALSTVWPGFSSESARGVLRLDTIPADDRLRWFGLAAGEWPSSTQEILIDAATADSTGLQLGSAVTVAGYDGVAERTVTVVGFADTAASAFSGVQNQAFATAALVDDLAAGGGYGPIVVIADAGASVTQLRDELAAALPADIDVLTSDQQIAENLADITGGAMVLTIVLLGFAATAVVASGIVIANTFTILMTQRRRHIALTRCIGGSRGQVRREVLAEAGLVGAIGSVIGIAAGVGIGALGARLAGLDAAGPVIPLLQVALVGLGGITLTSVAAYAPASRAMRIVPMAALRPVNDEAEQRRLSLVRVLVAGSLAAAGVLLMAWAVSLPSLLVGMAGGVVSACGILLLTRSFLPAALRVVGRLGGAAGPPGRLAATNASRHPARAAATTAALMLGVGLIVTLQVGASSAQASLDRAFTERYPVDVAVTGSGSPVAAGIGRAVIATAGIRAGGEVRGVPVRSLDLGDGSSTDYGRTSGSDTDAGPDGVTGVGLTLLGVSDEAAAALSAVPAELRDDTVIVPNALVSQGLSIGDRISVSTAAGSGQFLVAAGTLAGQGIKGDSLITTAAGLARLAPDAPVLAVWAGLIADADLPEVTAALNRLIAAEPDLSIGGSAPERAAVGSALGTIITLATALLAVAVVIAIVGIGNTLALSVIERTRESALLRALGLHRRQLRLMLAVEAALLALVGAGVGALAGIGYGWVGAASAFGEAGEAVVLAVPWAQLGLVVLLAVIAALIASVLPARRAAAATPTQALAEV